MLAAAVVAGACQESGPPSEAALKAYAEHKRGPSKASTTSKPAKPAPAMRIKVTVVKGEGIPDVDGLLAGDTDPYVILDYEGQRHKTAAVQGSLNPKWGDSFVLDLKEGGILSLTLMDAEVTSDQKIAVAITSLPAVAVGAQVELQVKFSEGKRGVVTLVVAGLSR